jgi:hypothetical protein
MRHSWILLIIAIGVLALTGCTQDSVNDFKAAEAELSHNPQALDDLFSGEIVFCRRLGKKTGKIFGEDDIFKMAEKSSVMGVVDFANAELGKTYGIHLVWLGPDRHEMFRYYAEVVVEATGEGGYTANVKRKKMANKDYLREKVQEKDEPGFRLSSKLNTSLVKEREPGTYALQVYLHRELLLEKQIELRQD